MRKKLTIAFAVALTLLVVFSVFYFQNKKVDNSVSDTINSTSLEREKKSARIGETTIFVEEAITEEEKTVGLSYRQSLPEDAGLLFTFDIPDFYGFWMKDMKFSIDIIWLDQNFIVIDLTTNIKPESFPEVFTPKEKSLYVLEVNSGFVEKNEIQVGDELVFSQN